MVALKEQGLVDLDRGDPQTTLSALVADVNARGGINGRMIVDHLEVLSPIDQSAAFAACVKLTEDIGVFAVLAPFVGPNTEVNSCLNSQNETMLVGGQPTVEQFAISKAPWISPTMYPERRMKGVVKLMEEAGLLGDKVGLSVGAAEESAADDVVIPALEALGKTVVKVVQTSTGDQVAGTAEWQNFIEKFRSEAVDSVVMVENTATFGSSELAVSGLDAQFLVVDSNQLVAGLGNRRQVDPNLLVGIIGSGSATPEEVWELESTQDCVRAFEEYNPDIKVVPTKDVEPGGSDWLGNILIFCAPLRLFELAANAAGPDLNYDTFVAGAEGLGEIDIPGQAFASMAPGKLDAADAIRLTEFDPTAAEFGGAKAYGSLERIE